MLDDLKLIHHRDSHDLLGMAGKQAQQLVHPYRPAPAAVGPGPIQSVVFAGTGALAYGAELAKVWMTPDRPMEIIRDYRLPAYVGPGTLCIVAGDADDAEVAACLARARSLGAAVIELPPAGRLSGPWPSLGAVAAIFDAYGLAVDAAPKLAAEAGWLAEQLQAWVPTVSTARNPAKQIAQELMGKSAVIYAGPELFPVAQHWKSGINRYAGQLAWCGRYPDFFEAELTGWSRQPVQKPYAIIELCSGQEPENLQRQFAVSRQLLSGRWPSPHAVQVSGDSVIRRLVYASTLGDFVALYLAMLNGVDPGDMTLAEKARRIASAAGAA